MDGSSTTGLGIHLSLDGVRATIARDGQVEPLSLIEPIAGYLSWLRLPDRRLACVPACERIGIEGEDHDASKALLEVFRQLQRRLSRETTGPVQVAIAVPRTLPEPQRRRLLSTAQDFFGRASLIDSTTAALHAAHGAVGDGPGATVAVVAEDIAMEMCIASPDDGDYRVRGYRSLPGLAGHALYHQMLQKVVDRLPADMQRQLAAADDETLSKLSSRLTRTRSMLSRVASISCPLVELASPPPTVPLTADDVTSWMEPRWKEVRNAIEELAREAGQEVERVMLVGTWGEWPGFLAQLEDAFGPPAVYVIDCLADGAALAATALEPEDRAVAPGALGSTGELHARLRSYVTFPEERVAAAESPEDKLQSFFSDVAQLVATGEFHQVRALLGDATRRAETVLAALGSRGAPEKAASAGSPTTQVRGAASESQESPFALSAISPRARRLFDDAERFLRAGRVLEAVGSSHLAHQQSATSHEALMYLLDIHRRGAKLLADAGEHEMAEQQLRCALQHRQGDERTQRALGQQLLRHAAFEENEKRSHTEALRLYKEALDYVDDDAVPDIVERLGQLQELAGSRD